MALIKLSMEVCSLKGFAEQTFVSAIAHSLQEEGATKLTYAVEGNKYIFDVEYEVFSSQLTYELILGCFTNIEKEYPYVKVMSINPIS